MNYLEFVESKKHSIMNYGTKTIILMQSKKYSLAESLTNTFTGLFISFIIQLIIYPVLNIPVKLSQNIIITIVFTVASIVRGYCVRRIFNQIRK